MSTRRTRGLCKRALTLVSAVVVSLAAVATLAGPARAATPVLIGFGDSVAAGYRAGPLASTPYSAACARSTVGYPDLVGATLGYVHDNLACSGATAAAGLNGAQTTGLGQVPAQLRQAAGLPRATLATVTIGANDVRWSYWLAVCATSNCATTTNTLAFRALLATINVGIVRALYQMVGPLGIRQVLLTGYYDPLGALAGPVFGLTSAEISWYRARLADVNAVLKADAGLFLHVRYAAVRLDAAAGDIQLSEPGIFHPTLQGQRKLATQVLAARG